FMMPNVNGLQLLKAIRTGRARCRRDLPVAMLTAVSDQDLVGAALALDVNAFLLKPASVQALSQRIARMLEEPPLVQEPAVYEAVAVPETPTQRATAASAPPPAAVAPRPRARPTLERVRPRMRMTVEELSENVTLAGDLVNR